MFRRVRITVLVYVLVVVSAATWLAQRRSTAWDRPLWVLVYPISADGSAASRAYIAGLERETFAPIGQFVAAEARRYGVGGVGAYDAPVSFNLARPVTGIPPAPPARGGVPAVMWWSLRLRWWAWRVEWWQAEPPAHVQMFVLYHDPSRRHALPHSVGLQKGMIGVVHAFAHASMTAANNVVIAHELLHTLGATDKYDVATNLPLFPAGFAEPSREPLFPQRKAEIMAGRIPLAAGRASMPEHLGQTVVGPETAAEIRWR